MANPNDMSLIDLEMYLDKIEMELTQAIEPIIQGIEIPRTIELSIDINLLNVSEFGEATKYVLRSVSINPSFRRY